MGACYGAGVLGIVPLELLETQEIRIQFLKEFTGFGLSHRFREVIDGRVAEFRLKKGEVEMEWLSEEEGAPILQADKGIGGSAPYSALADAFYPDTQILLPGFRGSRDISLKTPEGHPFQGYLVGPLRNGIAFLESSLKEWQEFSLEEKPNRDFILQIKEALLQDFRRCSELRLPFTFGY